MKYKLLKDMPDIKAGKIGKVKKCQMNTKNYVRKEVF